MTAFYIYILIPRLILCFTMLSPDILHQLIAHSYRPLYRKRARARYFFSEPRGRQIHRCYRTDIPPISILLKIVDHPSIGPNSRKENKYRKPINDKLLIGSRDGAGQVDVTMLDVHRFESRHKPPIIIGRIVNG